MTTHPGHLSPALLVLGLGACVPEDPLDDAWSDVFEVQRVTVAEGCEVPEDAEPIEPPADFVGIGLGELISAQEVQLEASAYWCEDQNVCGSLPFTHAALEVATEERIEGVFGQALYDYTRICKVWWTGIDATLSGDALTFVARTHASEDISTATGEDCDDLLGSRIRETCDETTRIEAERAP